MSKEIVLRVEGIDFHADSADDEPRVADEAIALRAGHSRPRDVRKTIARLIAVGFLNDSDVRATVAQTSASGGRPGTRYWLTETGALKLIAKLETPAALAILGDMVRVYRAAIRQLREPALLARQPVEAEIVNGATIGEDPFLRDELGMRARLAAKEQGKSIQAIHGAVRKSFRCVSLYLASRLAAGDIRRFLDGLAMRRLMLPAGPARRALKPADARQQRLFDVN